MAKRENNLLILRGDVWYYQRRVPKKFRHIESRSLVRHSLNTDSLKIARRRRDALCEADDLYWSALNQEAIEKGGVSEATHLVQSKLYEAAAARAIGYGFTYKTTTELVNAATVDEVMDRVEALSDKYDSNTNPPIQISDALLGGIEPPKAGGIPVSSCFRLYVDEIEFDAQRKKSPAQRRSWENSKRVAIDYFIHVVGDIPMTEITREHGLKFRNWWFNRIKVGDENGTRPTPNTANRRLGTMRTLYREYFSHIGEEDRPNPFRNLSFKEDKNKKRPPFTVSWMREKILTPTALKGLNSEARVIFLTLVETGARPSEICNLKSENIHLGSNVPYIEIIEKANREVKATASNRKIPLVGISLEAIKSNPDGFPRYFDKDTLLSNTLMKYFRENGLLETNAHKIYSIRHSFEDRMLEAGLDYGLRCILMGHKNERPSYGDGGSMEYRRDELLKIVHPYPKSWTF